MSDDAPNPGQQPDKCLRDRVAAEDKADRQERFLRVLAVHPQIAPACRAVGITRTTVYEWLKEQAFRERFEEAKEDALESLEREAWERATRGRRKLKFYQDTPLLDPRKVQARERAIANGASPDDPDYADVYYIEEEPSDPLLMFLMKANLPRYRDVSKVEVGGSGAPVTIALTNEVRATLGDILKDDTLSDGLTRLSEAKVKGRG